jgi:hypothetical protein
VASDGQEVSVLYDEPTPRPCIPITGAIGGPSPDGSSVLAHVYLEYATIPAREEHEVDAQGGVDFSKGSRITRGNVTRLVQATLAMSPEVAIRFGNWLVQNGSNAMEHRKKNQP